MMMMNQCSKEAGGFKDGPFIIDEEKQMTGIGKLRSIQKGEVESKNTNKNPNSPRIKKNILGDPSTDSAVPSILDEAFPKIRDSYEISEGGSVTGNKFFSTPLPSGTKAKKKLTPVLEVDIESSDDLSILDNKATPNLRSKHTCSIVAQEGDTVESAWESFFTAECQEIADQLEGKETEGRCSGKRKVDELDVSCIDAEPPPYECTPMKSMLACEVANILRSLDNSPANEGPSMLGDSLLDLEKLDLQLIDFNSKDKGKLSGKIQALNSSIEGIFVLGEGKDGAGSSKKQKMDPMKENQSIANNLSYSSLSLQAHGHSESKGVGTRTRLNVPQEINRVERIMNLIKEAKMDKGPPEGCESFHSEPFKGPASSTLSPKKSEAVFNLPTNTTVDMEITNEAIAVNTNQVIESVGKLSFNMTQDRSSISKVPDDNTTQDLFPVYKVPGANTTQLIESVPLAPTDATQDIIVEHDEVLSVNATQDIETLQIIAAKTTHYKVPGANTTQMIESIPLALTDATQDIVVEHDEVLSVNATQDIETLQKISANTTQDIVLEEGGTVNTTQVIETGLQTSANTTQDILHDEVNVAYTTQVIEAPFKSSLEGIVTVIGGVTQVTNARTKASPNTTLDILLERNVVLPIVSQMTCAVQKMTSFNTTQDVVSDPEDVPCNQKADTVPKMICSNTTQDIVLESETTGMQVMDVLPKITSINTTQDVVLEPVVLIDTLITDVVTKFSSSNTTQEILPELNTVGDSKLTNAMLNVSSSNTTNDIVLDPAMSKMCSESLIKVNEPTPNVMAVEPVSKLFAITTPETTIIDEKVGTSNTTVSNDMKDPSVSLAPDTPQETIGEAPIVSQNVPPSPRDGSVVNTTLDSSSVLSVDKIQNTGGTVLKDLRTLSPVCNSDLTRDTVLPEVSPQVQVPVPGVAQVSQESISMLSTLTEDKEESSKIAAVCEIARKTEDANKISEATSRESSKLNCHEPTGDMGEMEPCEVAQEAEAAHDESVFSVSSLSFVTSTPLPGLNNFQFKKSSQDSMQHDPNLSVCSMVDESANKASEEEKEKSHQGGTSSVRATAPVSQLPCNPRRGFLQQPRALQSGTGVPTSAIPSARRSLALSAASVPPKLTKEQVPPQIPPRGTGIPTRGSIRPPLTRSSLVRASVGNAKPSIASSAANTSQNRTIGGRFRTPRAAAAKGRPSLTHAQITNNGSVIRPPSRLIALSSAQVPKDVMCAPTTSVRPAAPSGAQTFGLLRHAPSSIRPPIPLQRTGLAMKKPQRETSVSAKNDTLSAKRNAQVEVACVSGEPARSQGTDKPKDTVTADSEIVSPSEAPECLHLQTCPCCRIKYQELLQKIEELRNHHGENVRL